jgi:hypothetical protein
MIMTITKKRINTYGIVVAILSGFGIVGYKSMIPTNGNTLVLGHPINHFVKAKYYPGSVYAWVSMPSSSSKGLKSLSRGKGAAASSPVNSHTV